MPTNQRPVERVVTVRRQQVNVDDRIGLVVGTLPTTRNSGIPADAYASGLMIRSRRGEVSRPEAGHVRSADRPGPITTPGAAH
jgi:hypothetical protein